MALGAAKGGTDDAARKIKIRFHEFGHAADVGALESGDVEPIVGGSLPGRDLRPHADVSFPWSGDIGSATASASPLLN